MGSGSEFIMNIVDRFERKFQKSNGCWEWTASKTSLGYGQFNLFGTKKAHRVAWSIYRGAIPGGMCVLHKCDNPSCVNPDHLFLGTLSDNMQDCFNKGRGKIPDLTGTKHHQAKLNDDKVIRIRRLLKYGFTGRSISKLFKVAETTISEIKRGNLWKHV